MRKELIYVHSAVFLFGLSGLFAKWITLQAHVIVLGRVFFAALFLFLVLLFLNKKIVLYSLQSYIPFILLGGVLALHWGSFFHAIQLSTVAIGLVTFATFPIFASLLEPLFFRESFQKKLLILGLLTFIGVVIIVGDAPYNSNIAVGAMWGLVSGLTFALLSILNRRYVQEYSSLVIGFYQNTFAFIWLIPFVMISDIVFTTKDISLLLLLGVVFTGIAHVLFIQGLSKINVRSASIISSLEPVYGIIAAMLIFHETPDVVEWIGILIILGPAMYVSIIQR